jgi:hypothetical protein
MGRLQRVTRRVVSMTFRRQRVLQHSCEIPVMLERKQVTREPLGTCAEHDRQGRTSQGFNALDAYGISLQKA